MQKQKSWQAFIQLPMERKKIMSMYIPSDCTQANLQVEFNHCPALPNLQPHIWSAGPFLQPKAGGLPFRGHWPICIQLVLWVETEVTVEIVIVSKSCLIKQNLQTRTVIDRADKRDAPMIYLPGVLSEQHIYLRSQELLKFNPQRPSLQSLEGSHLQDHLKSPCK